MHDPLRMGRVQCIGNLDAERKQRVQLHRTIADDMFQRRAVQVLHDDERLAVLLADVVNGADIRMIERRRSPRLAAESLQRLPVLGHFLRQEFQRDEAVKPSVFRLVNHTHAAAAKLFDDAVMRDNLAHHTLTPRSAEILRSVIGGVNNRSGPRRLLASDVSFVYLGGLGG